MVGKEYSSPPTPISSGYLQILKSISETKERDLKGHCTIQHQNGMSHKPVLSLS